MRNSPGEGRGGLGPAFAGAYNSWRARSSQGGFRAGVLGRPLTCGRHSLLTRCAGRAGKHKMLSPSRRERGVMRGRGYAVESEYRAVANPHADHVDRLIAVVEEQAQTLVRTAFSTTVREAGRPVGRGVRPRRQHAGAGGDRHARPRQFDGGGGQAFPRRLSAEDDEAGRPLHHQRPVADLRPSARSDRGQPDLPARRAGRPLRLHRPCRRYRRARHGAGRAPGLRGGAVDPADGAWPAKAG